MKATAKEQELLHTPEGVRDIYGREYAEKSAVIKAIMTKVHTYGYEDIQTPTFEFFDVFSKEIGTTPSRELYKFFDKEGNTLVLRPDFTPSVARCAAKYYMDQDQPMRFSYQGNVFANTSNLQGKLKESTQMGCELIGDSEVYADAEMIAMLISSLKASGLKKFQISIGNVEYFKGICEEAGIDEDTENVLREFISGKNYFGAEELLIRKGVSEENRSLLLQVTDYIGTEEALKTADERVHNKRSKQAVKRLKNLYDVLKEYGDERYVSFDLSMLSKYNYYTGVIFKGFTYGVGDAVASGGRYDNLLSHFGKDTPAIGCVIFTDLLLEALRRQNITIQAESAPEVVTYTDANFKEHLQLVQEMRRHGRKVSLIKA